MAKDVRISVLMSVYNDEKYLRKSVNSALEQSFSDFEFIIIDDGSTDKSLEIVKSYKDPRIRIVRNKNNIGLTKSLNKGLQFAQGEYIARMDADDIALPDRLGKQIDFMDKNPGVGVLGTAIYVIDEAGRLITKSRKPLTHPCCVWNLLFRNSFYHPTVMIKKDLLLSVEGYSPQHKAGQDRDLWIRVFDKTKLANLKEPLLLHRKHRKQISHNLDNVEYKERIESRQRIFSLIVGREISYKNLKIMSIRRKLKRHECGVFVKQLNLLYKRVGEKLAMDTKESAWILRDYLRLLFRPFMEGSLKIKINVVKMAEQAIVAWIFFVIKKQLK